MILASLPFLVLMTFTPGPNNIMLASSGVNFGFRATIPHILGVTFGFPVMMLCVGLGLAPLFLAVPGIHMTLKLVGIAYLVYLAWRIATVAGTADTERRPRPLNFLQAAAFQWVNVKALIIAITAVTTYTVVNQSLLKQVAALAAANFLITLASCSTWTLFGHGLRQYLNSTRRLQVFNWSMAALLLGSIVPALREL